MVDFPASHVWRHRRVPRTRTWRSRSVQWITGIVLNFGEGAFITYPGLSENAVPPESTVYPIMRHTQISNCICVCIYIHTYIYIYIPSKIPTMVPSKFNLDPEVFLFCSFLSAFGGAIRRDFWFRPMRHHPSPGGGRPAVGAVGRKPRLDGSGRLYLSFVLMKLDETIYNAYIICILVYIYIYM